MDRSRRLGRVGGLTVSVAAAAPFAYLWILQVRNAKEPPTAEVRLDMAIWMAVFATPWVLAAQLLWRAWWLRAGAGVAGLDGPARLLAVAAATLPADRRDWGAAMAAELAQVQGPAARWRFAAGCARAAVCPPGGHRAAVVMAGALTFPALAATGLATGAILHGAVGTVPGRARRGRRERSSAAPPGPGLTAAPDPGGEP